jgi:hypothetical protein
VWPVSSFLTRMYSTSQRGIIPLLSWPMRIVVRTPRFLCCRKKTTMSQNHKPCRKLDLTWLDLGTLEALWGPVRRSSVLVLTWTKRCAWDGLINSPYSDT